MLIRRPTDILPSEITSGDAYLHRREWLKQAASMGLIAGLPVLAACDAQAQGSRLAGVKANPAYAPADEKINKVEDFRNYCNFYEFGTDKTDPPVMAKALKTRPWTVAVEGEVLKPKTFDIDDLMKLAPLEERIYRFRCVEAWSMVVPWIGFPLSALINQVQPKGNAKFVEFVTLADKAQMPGLRSSVLDWPYVEGLRLDEAMHPLTLLTFGAFGEVLAALKEPEPPASLREAGKLWDMAKAVWDMKPARVSSPPCQEVVVDGPEVDLAAWPIQHCWPGDIAPLITWGLTVTRGPNKTRQNLGIYRQQVIGRNNHRGRREQAPVAVEGQEGERAEDDADR